MPRKMKSRVVEITELTEVTDVELTEFSEVLEVPDVEQSDGCQEGHTFLPASVRLRSN